MSRTSKSPRTVLLIALDVAKRALPEYAHRCSPKKFTQHQLFACLVLKSFCRTDYRGVVAMLREWSDLRAAIGLEGVPHFTTLQKTTARLLRRREANRLLEVTLACADEHSPQRTLTKLAAIDGSGFEAHHISRYFVRRCQRGFKTRGIWQTTTYRRYPKIGLVCDCATHLVIAAQPGRGPGADITHLDRVMVDALSRRRIHTLLADAGYDAEWAHEFLRNDLDIRSIIPAGIGRPTARAPSGRYRRQMKSRFPKKTYGQRWQVETVFSMIKRRLGATLSARTRWSQDRALMLKVITHNIMIICYVRWGFLQSRSGVVFGALGGLFGPTGLGGARAECRWGMSCSLLVLLAYEPRSRFSGSMLRFRLMLRPVRKRPARSLSGDFA